MRTTRCVLLCLPVILALWGATRSPDYERLDRRHLLIPIPTVQAKDLRDTFNQKRDGRPHEALDIPASRGTPVVAVDYGAVKKLFTSARGGLTVYQFDREEQYCYYYAHLDRYASGVKEGVFLNPGDLVGYVGATGNAAKEAPHLHFAIFKLGPEKRWWEGVAVNPYPLLTGNHHR